MQLPTKHVIGVAVCLVPGLLLITNPAWGKSAGQTASPKAKAGATDPFNGNSQGYEKLLREARRAQIERKLAQDQLQIARFEHKRTQYAPGAKTGSDSSNALKALNSKIATLERKVDKLTAHKTAGSRKKTTRRATPARPAVSQDPVPHLAGLVSDNGGRGAWLRLGKTLKLVRQGDHVGHWKVILVGEKGVLIKGPHGRRHALYPGSAWSGQAVVTSSVTGNSSNTSNGYSPTSTGPAPGSTPDSSAMLTRQGTASVLRELKSGSS